MKLRITDVVKIVREVDLSMYDGMTAEQAAEYERNLDLPEKIEAFLLELEQVEPEFDRTVEIVEEESEGFDYGASF